MVVFKKDNKVVWVYNGKRITGTVSSVIGSEVWCEAWSDNDSGFVDEEDLKLEDKMDKYTELKNRIEGLGNGWDKEADDIVKEIIGDNMEGRPLIAIPCNSDNDNGIEILQGNWKNKVKGKVIFPYTSQCSKNTAFKKALLWLLDHSDIKKNDKQDKIEELEKKMDGLRNELKELKSY